MRRAAVLSLLLSSLAHAQGTLVADPATGLALPVTPLAGDQEATATVVNPAGLVFLGGTHLEAAFTGLRGDAVGMGAGLYLGSAFDVPFFTRLGLGIGVEKLLPPRDDLAVDPGRPLRLTLAGAMRLGGGLSFGAAWRHSYSDAVATGGFDNLDLGLSGRLGSRLAFGAVARDVDEERRWDLELVVRPTGTDALEIGAGVVIGEEHDTYEPRLRLGVRVARGLHVRGAAELLERIELEKDRTRELRATLGLEVSFGRVGLGAYGVMQGDGIAGATFIARMSAERYPSVQARGDRIERIKLSSNMDDRDLSRVLFALRRHERDGGVRALFLQIDGLSAGWGTIEELRDAVTRLRAKGTRVFVYLVAGTTREYYLAAAGDKIYLDAGGGIRLTGLASSVMFFKDAFDKVGVTPQFEKIEEYKSAPETFTKAASSPEAKAMRTWILDDIYDRVIDQVARDRRLAPAEMKKRFDDGPYTAAEALAGGLVDAVVEPTDVDRLVAGDLGELLPVSAGPVVDRPRSWSLPQVAVIYLAGDIVDGKSQEVPLVGQKVAGGETLAAALAWARDNGRVKAIVLRVDSPGGSALASEIIAREGFRIRGQKPFIVSIGDVAASGGYFAAAPADLIFAQPSSITGSIGIFTGKFDVSGLLKRLGVGWETMTRGPHADMESMLRPYTDEERVLIKGKLRYYYMRFVGAVARGRAMTEAEVDAVGRGQVFTGAQAKTRKLVDRHGGIVDALLEAKRRAGLDVDDPVEIVMLPRAPSSLLSRLFGIAATGEPTLFGGLLGRVLPASLILGPSTPQARLPFVMIDE